MIWTPYDWLNKFYCFYVAAVAIISSGRGLRITACHISQPCKVKLSLHKPFLSQLKQLYISNKMDDINYQGGCGVCGHHKCAYLGFTRCAGLGHRYMASG